MIKYKKMLMFTGITMLLVMSSTGPVISQTPMTAIFGTNFSEDFAMVIDLNVALADDDGVDVAVQVLEDIGGTVDPAKVNPVDQNEGNDQEFFMSHFNSSGMNSIYLALNKIEFDLKATVPVLGEVDLGIHINGSAPFQSLTQYFNVLDKDVFISNVFRGYVAYTTTPDDPTIGTGDDVYLGYTLVESNFVDLLNTVLSANLGYTIPQYGYEQLYTNTAEEKSFGMRYTDFFVVWQDVTPTAPNLNGLDNNFDNVVTGADIVAASVFDYLEFRYTIQETAINATHTQIDVITEYDIGPMSLLITKDGSTQYNAIESFLPEVTSANSFHNPTTNVLIQLSNINAALPDVNVIVPALSFYTGDAVEKRIDAAAVFNHGVNGFGIAVVTSTNVIVVGEDVDDPVALTNAQDSVIPLNFDGNQVYETSFEGKSTYDRTHNNGTVETDLPVYISTRSPSDISTFLDVHSVADGYFKAQSLMTYGLNVLSARELNPDRFGSITGPGDLDLTVEKTRYLTFVQMPLWSGLEVTQDPTFSAVAAVPQDTDSSSTDSNGTVDPGVPGFEFYAIVLTIIPLVLRRKIKKD